MASYTRRTHGGYRITVITPVCGTGNQGSIPCSHPYIIKASTRKRWGFYDVR